MDTQTNNQDLPRRKRIRLHLDAYAEPGCVCSVTIVAENRAPIFHNQAFAIQAVKLLIDLASVSSVALHAYCLMSDHLHLLISPPREASIIDFVREFKSRSTRLSWQHGFAGTVWQRRFYDRFLRAEDDVIAEARYILENPVRGGLVAEWKAYPFSGSLVYNL